jgi:hypothetical protein
MIDTVKKNTILVLISSCTIIGNAQENIVTNLDLLSTAVDEVAEEAFQRFTLESGSRAYYLDNKDQNKLSRYITDRFFQSLMDRGIKVHMASDSLIDDIVFSMHVIKASVEYKGIHRHGFLSKGVVEREADVGISLRVIDGQTQRVEWVGQLDKSVIDRIPLSELNIAEEDGFLLGHPVRPKDRGVRRWAEPLLVLGTVGCTAYLFYSVRSR